MNQNSRFISVLALALVTFPGWGVDTVIDQLYGLRNYELADAYWSAGQRFTDLGQVERGDQFKAQAKRLFQGYVPGQAPAFQPLGATTPAVPVAQVPQAAEVREKNLQGEKITRLQFQKLLRGYLTGSASTVAAVLAPSISVQGVATQPTQETLASFLNGHPSQAGAPEDLFMPESLQVSEGSGQQILIQVSANPEAGSSLTEDFPFWKASQVYTFDRVGETWKLVAIEGK